MKSFFKSLGAVVAGFLAVVILSIVTDQILHATGIMPAGFLTQPMALLAFAYRTVYTIFGSYVTARLAPHHPMRHAIILGCLGTLAGLGGAIATKDMGLGPAWYAWSLAVEALPCAWIGGKLTGTR